MTLQAGPRGHQGHWDKQSLPAVMPVFGGEGPTTIYTSEQKNSVRGIWRTPTLIFYVRGHRDAPGGGDLVKFTLTVSEERDHGTGTACGYTCATLKLKKAPF